METVTCSICNEGSLIFTHEDHTKSLYRYGCNEKVHKKAEASAPLAGCFKCQLCNRSELKARDGSYYQGCNVFERHPELGLVGFHDMCFRIAGSKLQAQLKV